MWGSEFEPEKWDRIRAANDDLFDCTGTAGTCVLEAVEALNAKMPLYVLAQSDWLERHSGPPEGLMLLHREGKLVIFRLWPEPVPE